MRIKDLDAFLMFIVALLVLIGIFMVALHIWQGLVPMGVALLIGCLRLLWLLAEVAFEKKSK